jgi:hypothetical protein
MNDCWIFFSSLMVDKCPFALQLHAVFEQWTNIPLLIFYFMLQGKTPQLVGRGKILTPFYTYFICECKKLLLVEFCCLRIVKACNIQLSKPKLLANQQSINMNSKIQRMNYSNSCFIIELINNQLDWNWYFIKLAFYFCLIFEMYGGITLLHVLLLLKYVNAFQKDRNIK